MAHWAKPGVKCVCIDSSPGARTSSVLVRGAIYHVRDVVARPNWGGAVGVRLVELRLPSVCDQGEWIEDTWRIERFRPLVTKSQEDDVALFAPILNVRERQST